MLEDLQRHAGKYYGKYSGEVIRNDDDKDNTGRIVVRMDSLFGASAEVTARPCFPYGQFFVPAVGSKVWIEFEAGHPDYAIWVGTWYPQGKAPPQAAISPPDNRVIQTASGHTIEILDKAGEEKITIKHSGNSFVTIDKDGSVLIGNNKGSLIVLDAKHEKAVLVEQHGNVITLDEKGIAITQKEAKTLVQLSDDTVHLAAPNVILNGAVVSCGAGAAEPTIMGTTFAQMWAAFIMHTHVTAVGPSGPPLPPALPLTPQNGLTNAVLVA